MKKPTQKNGGNVESLGQISNVMQAEMNSAPQATPRVINNHKVSKSQKWLSLLGLQDSNESSVEKKMQDLGAVE